MVKEATGLLARAMQHAQEHDISIIFATEIDQVTAMHGSPNPGHHLIA